MPKVGTMKNLPTFFLINIFLCLSLSAVTHETQKITLQLAWKNQFQFAGYYMAKEKGFYADANLDVEIEEDMGENAIEKVLAAEGRYGIGHSSLIVDMANGKKIKMLYAAFQSSPSVFIALKDSNISKIRDFQKRRIMVTSGMAREVSLQAMLKKHGLETSDLIHQKHSYTIESLLRGETDIMASYISNEPFLLKERGKEFVVFDPAEEGFDFYSDILFTSLAELTNHKERASAFMEASLKGWEYAFSHIDESVALIMKKHNTQNKSKEALKFEAEALKKVAYYHSAKLGAIEAQKLQRIYDIYNVMGAIQNETRVDEFFVSQAKALLNPQEIAYLEKKKIIKIQKIK
jgi:polar amino acid transport system substrate-binding protein